MTEPRIFWEPNDLIVRIQAAQRRGKTLAEISQMLGVPKEQVHAAVKLWLWRKWV